MSNQWNIVCIYWKDHTNVGVDCDRKLYEYVSLHYFYEHMTISMAVAWPVTKFKSLLPTVKNSVSSPHSLKEMEENMQKESLVSTRQL
jgi:hypothetical protein